MVNMEQIQNIFFGSIFDKVTEPQIKEIKINWEQHSRGILNIAKSIEPKFKITENNKHVLRLMLLYFSGNPVFITEMEDYFKVKGSFDKGLLIIGGVGTGKSMLFDIFKHYTMNILHTNSFQVHTAIDIIDSVNVSGVEYLEKYSHNFEHTNKRPNPLRCYIDDIASKNETVKNYGTEINVIEQLLSLRYNVFKRYGTLTHATSNKYPTELLSLYDARIVDRMKEMFNIIELSGESFRK